MTPTLLPERLEGPDGLLLRRWTPGDAELLGTAVSESLEHLRPWMPWITQEPMSLPDRRVWLAAREREWAGGGDVHMGVFLDGAAAGAIGLHHRIADDGLEIGYWTHPRFTRRGLATGAARLATTAALTVPGVTHVEIHHDRANLASRGVPRALGYEFVAERPGAAETPAEVGIDWIWRIDASGWAALQSP
jgi:RimJ/RimL family protein N-acetyltransferase